MNINSCRCQLHLFLSTCNFQLKKGGTAQVDVLWGAMRRQLQQTLQQHSLLGHDKCRE